MQIRKIKTLTRDNLNFNSRKKYLRLDKNERVTDFGAKFFKDLKISSFDLSAYPETGKIYKLLSKYLKISSNKLLLIPGSDFGYRICFEYFCNKKNKRVITLEPTFGMVEVYSKLFNVKQIKINYDNKLQLKFDSLIKSIKKKISLVIIANPNSPTGTILPKNYILKIILVANRYNVPVLIDEAYYGFYKFSYIKFLKKYNNLIILRTFSKGFGLAGLRAGYLISNNKMMHELKKFRPMYEINSIACKVLEKVLVNKFTSNDYIKKSEIGKKYFEKELSKLKINFLKTFANFIHIKLGRKKNLVENMLKKKKILTRKGPGVKGYEDYLRITIAPKKQMEKVLKVLKYFFNE